MGLDDTVGASRAALRHRDKTDNTLFIYTSDNGYTLGEHGLSEKYVVHEESVRVPFIVDFPGQNDAGYRFDGLVSTLDIAPTALDCAEVPIPHEMTGRSLKPLMNQDLSEENKRADWRTEVFLFYTDWQVAIRTVRYKYIRALNEVDHIELYDLQEDPRELDSVHADSAYEDVLLDMQAKLVTQYRANVCAPSMRSSVGAVLLSSPIDTSSAVTLARRISQDSTEDFDINDEYDLTWRRVDNSGNGFTLGQNHPENSSVFVKLPMKRTVDWNPYAEIHTIRKFGSPSAVYDNGEPVWVNYERRPCDFANPPMLEKETLSVLRVDGSGAPMIDIKLESA